MLLKTGTFTPAVAEILNLLNNSQQCCFKCKPRYQHGITGSSEETFFDRSDKPCLLIHKYDFLIST